MYNTDESDNCTISLVNETALSYETENEYNEFKCNAEFSCSVGQIPEYRIQRLNTVPSGSCYYHSLEINGNKYCTGQGSAHQSVQRCNGALVQCNVF